MRVAPGMSSIGRIRSPGNLRDSYIEISKFIHSIRRRPSSSYICRNTTGQRQRPRQIWLRGFHSSTQRWEDSQHDSKSASWHETLETLPEENSDQVKVGLSQEQAAVFERYSKQHYFGLREFGHQWHWSQLIQLNEGNNAVGEIPSEPFTLHGYLTVRREASKSLTFGKLVDPHLRNSIQIMHYANEGPEQDSPKQDESVSNPHSPDQPQKGSGKGTIERTPKAFAVDSPAEVRTKLRTARPHTPVALYGFIKKRPPKGDSSRGTVTYDDDGFVGPTDTMSMLEFHVDKVHILNDFPENLVAKSTTVFPPEQRHLQFRTSRALRDNIRRRSQVTALARRFLFFKGFDEIETPLLFKSTPEGAREFIVPTRLQGMAYALPQSPQQYKQMLMASGFPKYFQFAKCFRDEDSRADRQPEFTQLDIEMAFAGSEQVKSLVRELLISNILPEFDEKARLSGSKKYSPRSGKMFSRSSFIKIPTLTYQQAMTDYGSDKPDLRLLSRIHRVDGYIPESLKSMLSSLDDPIVEILKINMQRTDPDMSRSFVSSFMQSPSAEKYSKNSDGLPGITVFDRAKPLEGLASFGHEAATRVLSEMVPEPGDIIVLQARPRTLFPTGSSTMLGDLRVDMHRAAVAAGHIKPSHELSILWVTEFPLFTKVEGAEAGNEGTAGLCSTHHPFTAPLNRRKGALRRLITNPLDVAGDHYDLVMNGVEVGGGSTRIHDAKLQEIILRDVLKLKPERVEDFRHLLNALEAGCPPHAGFALGLDRLLQVLLEVRSVRDVIAFPKDSQGQDRFVGSPSPLNKQQLSTYHLAISNVAGGDGERPKISLAA